MAVVDTRALDEVLKVQKCCAGLKFAFCLEGTDAEVIEVLEAVRQVIVAAGGRVRQAEMFCGQEESQFAVEDAAEMEAIRQQDKTPPTASEQEEEQEMLVDIACELEQEDLED